MVPITMAARGATMLLTRKASGGTALVEGGVVVTIVIELGFLSSN